MIYLMVLLVGLSIGVPVPGFTHLIIIFLLGTQQVDEQNYKTRVLQIINIIKLMSTQSQTLLTLAESLHLKNSFSISINTQYLDLNFSIVKQCLEKLNSLENKFEQQNQSQASLHTTIDSLNKKIDANTIHIEETDRQLKYLKQTIDNDLTAKFQELQEKTRSTHDIDKLIKLIEETGRFVTSQNFNENNEKIHQELKQIDQIRSQITKFIDQETFKKFKEEFINQELSKFNNQISSIRQTISEESQRVSVIEQKAEKASVDAEENNKMLKEINFTQMQQKIKKIKEQTDQKLSEFSIKLKKKIGIAQIGEIQKNIIDKLDRFLASHQKLKADKDETKQALLFLEKRLNEVWEIVSASEDAQENDPMFATKKWMCASCSKDLGKFQGKLGQFKPWSVFPCRELDPEKTGGFGYLNYVDKMAYKKGYSIDDTGVDRLNKTFFEKNRDSNSPKKMNTTRATNFMSNYGTSERNSVSLKEQYFRMPEKSAKFFRVKKELKKDYLPDSEKSERLQKAKPQHVSQD